MIALINVTWALLQTQKEKQRKISEQDAQVRRLNGDMEQLQSTSQRLRDLIEYKERQATDLEGREKQAQVTCTQLRTELKVAKDEIKKLSSLVLNREGRFNHEAKKKDQELSKLKERLLKAMSAEAKQAGSWSSGAQGSSQGISIEFVGQLVDKPEGQRGRWRTENEEQKRGDELLQRVILANQERNEFLAKELHHLQEKLNYFLEQLSMQVQCLKTTKRVQSARFSIYIFGAFCTLSDCKVGKGITRYALINTWLYCWKAFLNVFLKHCVQVGEELRLPTFLPTHSEALSLQWQSILHKVKAILPSGSKVENGKDGDDNDKETIKEALSLSAFVPLSEVKHTAPPEWVSRAAFTLPPSGKAETVRLRQRSSESKPRPKSSHHVSPYRGMQARNNTPGHYRSKASFRSGSMSPNSTSPTR